MASENAVLELDDPSTPIDGSAAADDEPLSSDPVPAADVDTSAPVASENDQAPKNRKRKQPRENKKVKRRQLKNWPLKCHSCGVEKPDHFGAFCPEIQCLKCYKNGHVASACPNTDPVCWYCGQEGHKSNFCPLKKKKHVPKGERGSKNTSKKGPGKSAAVSSATATTPSHLPDDDRSCTSPQLPQFPHPVEIPTPEMQETAKGLLSNPAGLDAWYDTELSKLADMERLVQREYELKMEEIRESRKKLEEQFRLGDRMRTDLPLLMSVLKTVGTNLSDFSTGGEASGASLSRMLSFPDEGLESLIKNYSAASADSSARDFDSEFEQRSRHSMQSPTIAEGRLDEAEYRSRGKAGQQSKFSVDADDGSVLSSASRAMQENRLVFGEDSRYRRLPDRTQNDDRYDQEFSADRQLSSLAAGSDSQRVQASDFGENSRVANLDDRNLNRHQQGRQFSSDPYPGNMADREADQSQRGYGFDERAPSDNMAGRIPNQNQGHGVGGRRRPPNMAAREADQNQRGYEFDESYHPDDRGARNPHWHQQGDGFGVDLHANNMGQREANQNPRGYGFDADFHSHNMAEGDRNQYQRGQFGEGPHPGGMPPGGRQWGPRFGPGSGVGHVADGPHWRGGPNVRPGFNNDKGFNRNFNNNAGGGHGPRGGPMRGPRPDFRNDWY